jgi:hypothetical protein
MIKKGREEIIYLLHKCIEKYQSETGKEIIQNTNRKNYEGLAMTLSEISKELPFTDQQLGHDVYPQDKREKEASYPFRKYDITGGQIKDALIGLVANPRNFLVDACYIYLYQMGRLAFLENPIDENLVNVNTDDYKNEGGSLIKENQELKLKLYQFEKNAVKSRWKWNTILYIIGLVVIAMVCFYIPSKMYFESNTKLDVLKKDLNILPYKITLSEKERLEGLWICYTGSPQARLSDPDRYQKIVPNIVEIKYKNGYFIYTRYGASFNHTGFAQFEGPNIVSIFSKVEAKDNENLIESPRHSLLELTSDTIITAISASWNFDYGNNNKIIGIREVYKKLGNVSNLKEVTNTLENASCKCKIIKWSEVKDDKVINKIFYIKNMYLDSLSHRFLLPLINENSIIFKDPINDSVIIKKGAEMKMN